jgi:hypothetical protein
MQSLPLAIVALTSAGVASAWAAETRDLVTFRKQVLTQEFWAEGAGVGDFNKDGHQDIVSGPFWYQGPEFTRRHEIYEPAKTFTVKDEGGRERVVPGFEGALGKNNAYSDNFLSYGYDFNADGWDDVLVLGFPGAESWWFENPKGAGGHWKRHLALNVTDNESPWFVDLTGDGRPEIVCSSNGVYGWSEWDPKNPAGPWRWRALSPNKGYHKFTHGLGVGDVNGDGRMDLLEKDGWWEQPASLEGDPVWKHHPVQFGTGGAQMFAYDVDGDGRNDVITSLAAHGYGLSWFRNVAEENGSIVFEEFTFMNKERDENRYGVQFSQLHALDLKDIDGDGLKDLITGKRFWAHGPTGDPEPGAPAVLYWFKLVRLPGGGVDWVPQLVDKDSGVGTQVLAADVTGNGRLDMVVGNKKGVFLLRQEVQKVPVSQWQAAQPKPLVSAR